MKRVNLFLILFLPLWMVSCELDNYDGPDATLYGSFFDIDTNELVEQDIINGVNIELIEHGYDPVTSQYLVVKVDGTYRNTMLFVNTYTIQPIRGNFVSIAEQDVEIKGETRLDFQVQPYIRVKNVSIKQEDSKIVATFTIEQTVSENVESVMLYAHPEAGVGINLNIAQTVLNIGSTVDPGELFTLEMDLEANSGNFIYEDQYFFRVGALIDVPEAKPNYAPAVRLKVNR